ncbi:MAG: tryptophan 7-halogenase [Deltaproteobacteria bacterium]|nr:tryptophan 7-halogenase [Deltaproteobacteria bacterium]
MHEAHIDCDVAIIGAGPAGTALATHLARDKKRVVIFERESFPRFRIGESLLPLNLALFRELGVEDELERRFIRKYAANFSNDDGTKQSRFPFANALNKEFPYCYEVERAELDQVLLDNATGHGAEVRMGYTVREGIEEGGRVVGLVAVKNDGSERVTVRCKVVADCSGRAAFFGSRLGLKRDVQLETRTSFFSHFENVARDPGDREGDIQIVAFEHGWFWMIPFKGNTTSVGMVVTDSYLAKRKQLQLGRPEERGQHDESTAAVAGAAAEINDAFLAATIAQTPYVRERLKHATQKFPARTIANFSYVMDRYATDGAVFVGDAGAFLDPVFSSGVFLTMKSAQLVAEDLRDAFANNDFSASRFARYEKRIRGAQAIFLKFIKGWYDPAFVDLFFAPRNFLGLKTAITSVLAADLFDPRHLWRLKLRIRLLFALANLHRRTLRRSHGGRSLVQKMAV